ncbi:hypothetical protein V6N12_060129 [Hibiscus sabdariffa]|uniref:Uncharacterized protein n=1 Tax=Hibiscus sabdariffa TaxID=183260 RepID=A0ABR2D3J3_9ROSI
MKQEMKSKKPVLHLHVNHCIGPPDLMVWGRTEWSLVSTLDLLWKLKLPALPLPLSHFVSDSVVALTSFVIGTHCSLTGLMPFSLPQ